jgi:hypothetical protein
LDVAVTTDGGNNWFIWNARTDLSGYQCCTYKYIADVEVTTDGSGRMAVNPNRAYGLQATNFLQMTSADIGIRHLMRKYCR